MSVRVLFLADTHLGFDLPVSPRIRRRRRGHDFLANYHLALAPALEGRVDLVVHGGDVFTRPNVPPSLVYQAFEPLKRVADQGVPVFVVPGNHERSRLPHARFTSHPGISVFDRPRTFHAHVRGHRIALAGFPFARKVRDGFADLLARTMWEEQRADTALLCMHQCVEGATVGPSDFTFRRAPDVVQARDIPVGFAAVLSGHIHRHQVITSDLSGRALAAPVMYPGSVERTSFAEMDDPKGYMILELEGGAAGVAGALKRWSFETLPARPMLVREVSGQGLGPDSLTGVLRTAVARTPVDAVLRVRVRGHVPARARAVLSAASLRSMAPAQMNLEVVLDGESGWNRPASPPRKRLAVAVR